MAKAKLELPVPLPVIFDAPVRQVVNFAELLLVQLDNDKMFLTSDGKHFERFVMMVVPTDDKEKPHDSVAAKQS